MKRPLKLVIGADHRGYELKQYLIGSFVTDRVIEWIDVGAYNEERSDYPEFAIAASKILQAKKADYGVLSCATGTGMAIAANRFSGVYAGVVWNVDVARLAREDDNVTMLVLPSDYISFAEAREMVQAWLSAEFKHGRYEKRLAMIDEITKK